LKDLVTRKVGDLVHAAMCGITRSLPSSCCVGAIHANHAGNWALPPASYGGVCRNGMPVE
jgi:hypothetical protein